MLPFTTDDAVTTLRQAENLNAALKHFLKREVRRGEPAERFVKDLRPLLLGSDPTRAGGYLERKRPQFDPHLIGIGGYAHSDLVTAVAGQVVERYADDFNATYRSDGSTITVSDQSRFDEIVNAANKVIDETLVARGFGASSFMKNVLLAAIFEQPVLRYLFAEL